MSEISLCVLRMPELPFFAHSTQSTLRDSQSHTRLLPTAPTTSTIPCLHLILRLLCHFTSTKCHLPSTLSVRRTHFRCTHPVYCILFYSVLQILSENAASVQLSIELTELVSLSQSVNNSFAGAFLSIRTAVVV